MKTNFFFYDQYQNKSQIEKIYHKYKIKDASLYVHSFNRQNHKIIFKPVNKTLLTGKLVEFSLPLDQCLYQINLLHANNNKKYTIKSILIDSKWVYLLHR